jgi:hypothetical protein
MKLNVKKMLPIAATSLLALTTVNAMPNDNAQMRNLENRVTALEQRKTAGGMINPQGRPQVRDGADLFIFGDLLYWNTHENGLQVAVKNSGSDANLSDSEVKTIHGKWNFGFRVGIGYNTPHDGWDLRLTWLRFTDHGRKNSGSPYIFPTLIHPEDIALTAPSSAASLLSSSWHMRLNQLDFDLGREFFVSKWLTLRPHFGLRSDWITQSINGTYSNFIGLAAPNSIDTGIKDRWFGIGLEGGLDTQWGLGGGWSLFGDLSGAILYGFHHLYDSNVNEPSGTTYLGLGNSYRISQPILDLEMGLRWDNMFSNDRFHLGVQIGWEHHVYFSQNQFPTFVSNTSPGSFVSNQGDLTFQGWTFEARFDF